MMKERFGNWLLTLRREVAAINYKEQKQMLSVSREVLTCSIVNKEHSQNKVNKVIAGANCTSPEKSARYTKREK